jgi:hypothetical protein
MKSILIVISALFFATSCDSTSTEETTGKPKSTANKTVSNWKYSNEEDKMTGDTAFFAVANSPTLAHFKFPYNEEGGSKFSLTIRKNGSGSDVALQVSKGYFLTNIMDDTKIRIRFDNEKPESYTCGAPADHSNETIFIYPEKKFINKLKKAKKIFIEATFYDEGTIPVEFNVDSFKWNH